jgi:DHA1 family bicyclomycin/chloramphenicol resistance-like MFS transporter
VSGASDPQSQPQLSMSRAELIGLMALMSAVVAFSIDSMLPALPEIVAELTADAPNRAQLILTSFVFGLGAGTFLTGPLSDAYGRRAVIAGGIAIFCAASFVAWLAGTLELVLAARVVQGFGAAAPRIVMMAVIRDLFRGREMAKIMSFIMLVFTIIPAMAPLLSTGIIAISDWRGIFIAYILFGLLIVVWMMARLPETLAPSARRPVQVASLLSAAREIFTHRTVVLAITCQMLIFIVFFCLLSMIHPIYEITFDAAHSFPYWFAGISLLAGSASLLNAKLVVRFGMHRLVSIAMAVQIVLSACMIAVILIAPPLPIYFALFAIWQFSLFFQGGMIIGNLNAIAMDPVGHIAGMAASIMSGISTIGAAVFAAPIGLLFDGSPLPLACASLACTVVVSVLLRMMARGQ